MPLLPPFNKTAVLVRPYGSGVVVNPNVPCNWAPALFGGEEGGNSIEPVWDAWIDVPYTLDIRHGYYRQALSNQYIFANGDEVRIQADAGDRTYIYVVVFVSERWPGTTDHHRRALLQLDHVTYP